MKKIKKVEKSWDDEVMEIYPILYCQRNKSMQETCMCWGFECGEGWKTPLSNLSAKLEALNMLFWPKYNVRIQADQVKEKFGTLSFYTSVIVDQPWYTRLPKQFLDSICDRLYKVDYKFKTIVDKEPWVEKQTTEYKLKSEYLKDKKIWGNCSNVKYEEVDGKYFKHVDIQHYRQTHLEPTKHKIIFKINKLCKYLANRCYVNINLTQQQEAVKQLMETLSQEYIKAAENECYDYCESCGHLIGNSWSPRCETTGWIKYICDKCAEKIQGNYLKNGDLYNGTTLLKTAKQLKSEQEEAIKKYKARRKAEKQKEKVINTEIANALKEENKQ